ncbi:MAG: LuxR C-terminal-related transcriptional regulator [Anaerolineales bacterium]
MRVLIIDEVRAVGEMIGATLNAEADIEVIGQAASLDEARQQLSQCEVAVVNVSPFQTTSLALVRDLRRLAGHIKIVVIGLAETPALMLQCVEAGVAGYALRNVSLTELLQTVRDAYRRAAHQNDGLLSPPLASRLLAYMAERGETGVMWPEALSRLTRREREVLALLQQGLTNQEIAQLLVIELGTVKNHVHNVLRKLNVNSRRDTLRLSRTHTPLWVDQRYDSVHANLHAFPIS